ncbi:MAG: NADP-dependent glyceraldehyde-3-phosphate dehydrogenase [Chitinophagaceae bacterium]|nr:NADP-dependent glyceraldehyde-3-phosphate dehydrogenase [Chitinophagaceae bacterium]
MDLHDIDRLEKIFPAEEDIPLADRLDPVHQKEYLLDGKLVQWSGDRHQVFSPVCIQTAQGLVPKMIGSYPLCTGKEAWEAMMAAVKAYDNGRGEWPMMTVAERIDCVEKFVQEMNLQKDLVVKLLMWEIGKSHQDAVKEFDRTTEYIQATMDALKQLDRRSSGFEQDQGIIAQIRRSPLGVVLCMGPFNYPLNETFTTLIPALIVGNTILFKPPKHGTLLHYPLLDAFRKCFPPGVVNTVYGRGQAVIPELMQSGHIDVLAMIGSSKVANELKKMHPRANRLRAVLGLDAKNAAVITKNADIALAVEESVLGSLSFNGQRCTAIKIIFVERPIAEEFIARFSDAVARLTIGMPWTKNVTLTPLPEPNKPAYLQDLIRDATKHGAAICNINGGQSAGSFVYPAVLYPVNSQMRIYREEQFGPVIPVIAFDSLQEPMDYIHESSYGQQISIFTNDSIELSGYIDQLMTQVSRININSQCQRGPDILPFTGRKDSAEGTLSVTDALRAFSIRSVVAAKSNAHNKQILSRIVQEQQSSFLSTNYIF